MTLRSPSQKSLVSEERANALISELVTLGFSRNEALIYLHLLQDGSEAGVSQIASSTSLHRQYVYTALPALIREGLAEEVLRGKQTKYKAHSPQIIETIGRKKALAASDLARSLNQISAIGNEQDFEVIQGTRAIQEYELLRAQSEEEGAEEYIIGGATTAFSELMGDTLNTYLAIRARKKTKIKYLGTADERPLYQKYVGTLAHQEYRFMSSLPKGETHMIIRKDSVSFYTFLTPPLVYIVKSERVANNYRAFFEMLWEMGKE
ncbi:MAG: hypothetical protein ACD_81C00011G0001 [uncultured bacterium]|uniref:Transcriptional regulator TrmB n=1 Tax=Candidatus Wolfebacteria bacterium GW2011_GWC2_39_22 TaxID=1619013 RepID=A0A0G0N7Z0_9BACT|nr:MAG: hypothetical protein ACD_81C00011G0001 [uncultured bacterium]KKR12274.1 MAG: Transcriptional regulator TrmB [Candidatus Wolfebacteria bacterium GW2011_GWC2_39_22]HBI25905.1 hypothetical protein [Candidatus Wolfebacteria bacterium]